MTQKATIAQVKIGNISIDGIMLPNGRYGISVPQIADLINIQQNYATQTLKRLLGNSFSPHKTNVSSIKQKINIVLLSDFMVILNKIAFSGNKDAQALFNQPHFNCDRNNMTKEQQELITDFELTAKRFASRNKQLTPVELILKTLDTF